jgi:Amt family ammonium transporter
MKLRVDDPLDAFAVHYGGGLCGVLCVGLFDMSNGLFYGEGFK